METNSFDFKDVEKLIEEFEELFLNPPFMISELANFIETLVVIYRLNDTWTAAKVEKNVIGMWEFVDERYKLSEKFDDAITLPAWLETLDNYALDLMIRHIIVPTAVKLLGQREQS